MANGNSVPGVFIVFEDDVYFIAGDQDKTMVAIRKSLTDGSFTIDANRIAPEEYFQVNSEDVESLLSHGISIRKGRKG